MIIAGAILLSLGLGSLIYGVHLNNSVEAQLNALFSSGNVDPGTGWIVAGIIALVVGIAFLVVGIIKKPGSLPKIDVGREKTVKPKILCSNCGKKLDGSPAFCPYCGKTTTPTNPRKDNVCPYCESIIPLKVVFCPVCGKQLSGIGDRAAASNSGAKSTRAISGWNTPTDSDL